MNHTLEQYKAKRKKTPSKRTVNSTWWFYCFGLISLVVILVEPTAGYLGALLSLIGYNLGRIREQLAEK